MRRRTEVSSNERKDGARWRRVALYDGLTRFGRKRQCRVLTAIAAREQCGERLSVAVLLASVRRRQRSWR